MREVINTKVAAYIVFGLPVFIWVVLLTINGVEPVSWEGFKLISVVVTVGTFIMWLFAKYLWKLRVFRKWLVLVPDLTGKWKGNLISDYKDAKNPIPTEVNIIQNLDLVTCDLKTGESTSKSMVAGFVLDHGRSETRIVYSYSNRPRNTYRHRSEIHNGTAELVLQEDGRLIGHYWTDRGTKGDIELRRVTKGAIQ